MITLKTIAREAGVHVATASAVLNSSGGNTRVSEATRKRVLATAKKLAYMPNESARRLRSGKSNAVAFLGGDLRNPFFAELAASLEIDLARHGLQLLVSHVGHSESLSIENAINILQQQGVQKIIHWTESSHLPKVQKRPHSIDLPIGFTTHDRPGIWLDLAFAIKVVVEDLIQNGFHQLGFFAPKRREESPSVSVRSQVFSKECVRRGLSRPLLAFYGGESWDLDAAAQDAEKVLKKNPQVEAWVGFNDIAGLGLLSRLPRKEISRVLSFDGTAMVRCWPGKPPHLDLKIKELSKKAAMAIANKTDPRELEGRENWLRPTLIG